MRSRTFLKESSRALKELYQGIFLENPFSQIKSEYFFSDVKTGRTAAAPPTTVFIYG